MTATQIEQMLKDRYIGKPYDNYTAASAARSVFCEIIESDFENSDYFICCRQDHSLNKIVLRNRTSGLEASIAAVVVKKKKGKTHRVSYGYSYTDYTFADFAVTLTQSDLAMSVNEAIENIKNQDAERTDRLTKLKADVETVKKTLGITDNYQLKMWIEAIEKNWYKLGL